MYSHSHHLHVQASKTEGFQSGESDISIDNTVGMCHHVHGGKSFFTLKSTFWLWFYFLILDGCHFSSAGPLFVYSNQMVATFGVLHHIHCSADEDLEVTFC